MRKNKAREFIYRQWKEWRFVIFFIIFVAIPVKSSLAAWNWVPTGSMKPTILEGDLIYVNKAAYALKVPLTLYRIAEWAEPERGDIVICISPEDGKLLVKRIIGRPGDTIEMRENVLFLNGRAVEYTKIESKYAEGMSDAERGIYELAMEDLDGRRHAVMSIPLARALRNFGPIKVPEDNYFVMGDNRDNSKDSRFFGFVERKYITGKAKGVIGSLDITDKYRPRLKRFFSSLN